MNDLLRSVNMITLEDEKELQNHKNFVKKIGWGLLGTKVF